MADKTEGVLAVLRYAVSEAEYERERCDHFGVAAWRAEADQAVAAVAELPPAAERTRDNLRCVLSVNCKCDDEFINKQTAEIDAAIRAMRGEPSVG